jgi:hypothetical protein
MTDYEKVKSLLTELGIGFDEDIQRNTITLSEGNNKVEGHPGFYVDFNFYTDGQFIKVGIWE